MEKIYIWIIALMVLSALVTIIKPRIKGKMGEATVSMLLKKLDKNKYQVVNDVLLSAEGGNTRTTQIDHVVVSIYGIFSIETKNYKGQIYGSESSAKWTQYIYGHKYSFMNPIYQNYAHVKALNALLQSHGYENIPVFSIVTFPGDAVLKIKTTKSQVVKWGAVTKTVKKLSVQSVLSREDMDKILGLEYGADDYMTKPFNILEVKARIKTILRRASQPVAAEKKKIIRVRDLEVNIVNRSVTLGGKEVRLTAKEFDLLQLFINNRGKVFSREAMLETVWKYDYMGDARTVDVHIRRLREKIERNTSQPEFIFTKWGVGYYFTDKD